MSLVTVFFGKIRAIVDEKQIDFFLNLGAKRTPDETKRKVEKVSAEKKIEKKPEKVAKNSSSKSEGDKGSGEPSSLRFHELKIKEMDKFQSIQVYTYNVTGKLIRKKQGGTPDIYQKNALRLLRRHFNAGQSR